MAFSDSWHKALVYFGLAEERHYEDDLPDPEPRPETDMEDRYRDRANVRRMPSSRRRSGNDFDDIFADDDEVGGRPTTVLRPVAGGRSRNGSDVRVHLVHPKSFND